jgi:tRNA-dihydrouridine synthase A
MQIDPTLSIAPMIDWTYSHFRVLMRLLAPKALLYTEMLTPNAVINNPDKSLYHNKIENPLAIQLGGSDKNTLIKAALLAEKAGFNEVNLNLGCPSDKVQSGNFGACLMLEKNLVSDCIRTMKNHLKIPVTAKIRIGVDSYDDYDFFADFADMLIKSGCDKLIIHARKALLKGLSPKQNRTIPKINYEYVYNFKQEHPYFPIIINGDSKSKVEIQKHLHSVDGVMLGRLAYENPYEIAKIHKDIYPETKMPTRVEIINSYLAEINQQKASISLLLKPLFNLYHGQNGASKWKQELLKIQQSKNLKMVSELSF